MSFVRAQKPEKEVEDFAQENFQFSVKLGKNLLFVICG